METFTIYSPRPPRVVSIPSAQKGFHLERTGAEIIISDGLIVKNRNEPYFGKPTQEQLDEAVDVMAEDYVPLIESNPFWQMFKSRFTSKDEES